MDGGVLTLAGYWAMRVLLLLPGYMASHNAFLHPLSQEEEARCLTAMRSGDRSARAKLIEHNLRLVAHIVKKLDNVAEDAEDLISVGTIGLIKAIETFDPNKGARLATYASRCIENEILMFLRAGRKTRHEVSLQEPIGADREGNELTLMDVLTDDSEPVADAVARQQQAGAVRRLLERLAGRERRVVEMRYGFHGGRCFTQREVARHLGVSRSYVSRIEKKAVRKLSREIPPDER